jgi:hypothetical protein
MKARPLKSDEAEVLALKALTWLAQLPEELDRFGTLTGVTLEDLRQRADDPEILAAVLDFLLADDSRLTGFCDAETTDPRALHAARRALPGA